MAYQSYQAFQQAVYDLPPPAGSQGAAGASSTTPAADHHDDHSHDANGGGSYLHDPPPLRTAYSEPVYHSYPTYSFSPAAFDPASGAFSGDQAPTPSAYDSLAGTTPGPRTTANGSQQQHGQHLSEPFSRAASSLVSSFSLPAAPPASRAFRNDQPPPQPPPPRHPGQAYSYPLPSAGPSHDHHHHHHRHGHHHAAAAAAFSNLQDIERQLGSFHHLSQHAVHDQRPATHQQQHPQLQQQQSFIKPPYAPSTIPPPATAYNGPSSAVITDSPSASDSIGSDIDGVGEDDDDEDEVSNGPTAVEGDDDDDDHDETMMVDDDDHRRTAARSKRRAASAPDKESASLADETEASRTPDELAEKGVTIDAVLEELRMSRASYNALSPSRKRQIRNKVSARAFRARKKSLQETLEAKVADRDAVIASLQRELQQLQRRNAKLEERLQK